MAGTWTFSLTVNDRGSMLLDILATRTDAADPQSPRVFAMAGVNVSTAENPNKTLAMIRDYVAEEMHQKYLISVANEIFDVELLDDYATHLKNATEALEV